MTKQTIEVDVPNGYEISKIEYFSDSQYIKVRIKEKIHPRWIVPAWREVKETDIPLTNDEPKLSFSVEECRNVRSLIKDFENLGWFVNPARSLLLQKITKFIKDK